MNSIEKKLLTRGNAHSATAEAKQAGADLDKAAPVPRKGILSLDELDGDSDWLAGPRPRPTPMLLTMDSKRGADDLGQVGVLPRGKVGLMVSPGGSGKTALLCQLALSVASGTTWLETFNVARGPERVVLALGEEDEDEIKLRLYDAAAAMGIKNNPDLRKLVRKNLRIISLYGRDAKILAPTVDTHGHVSGFATSEVAKRWMEQLTTEGDTALIILDPLSRFIQGDENDNTNATDHVTVLEQFTKLPGNPTVLCAHHANKAALSADRQASQGDSRGASAFVDGVRWMSVLTRKTAEGEQARIEFSIEKTNYTPPMVVPLALIREGCWRPYTPELSQPDSKPQSAPKSKAATDTRNRPTVLRGA